MVVCKGVGAETTGVMVLSTVVCAGVETVLVTAADGEEVVGLEVGAADASRGASSYVFSQLSKALL